MIRDTFKFVSITRKSIGSGDSNRRLALGVAMGMLVGLMPKDSLLTWFFFVILMISTANLLCSIGSGFIFSWIGYLLDSFTHKLGGLVLTNDKLESVWVWLYELPLAPWTRFNNTVVMGSLIVGAVLFVPVYLMSHGFIERYGPVIHQKIDGTWLYRWLVAPVPSETEGESA